MTRTYLDSGVLIAICRGKSEVAQRAFTLVNDPDREIILSEAVRLEVMPRAIYEQRHEEQKAIEEIFSLASVLEWSVPVLEEAYQLACENGIAAMDAIHLAFAVKAEADELVTTEKRSKPLFRFNTSRSSPQVVSIYER
jgi:predicted nucleic acid-binding protein